MLTYLPQWLVSSDSVVLFPLVHSALEGFSWLRRCVHRCALRNTVRVYVQTSRNGGRLSASEVLQSARYYLNLKTSANHMFGLIVDRVHQLVPVHCDCYLRQLDLW